MAGKTVGLITAIVIPPSVAAGLWRTLMLDHPVVTVLLMLAYEAVVAFVVFAGKIVEQLAKRWQQRIVENMDQALGLRFSRFPGRYRAALLGNLRYVDLKGLETIGFYTPELDEVFIQVSLAYQAPDGAETSVIAHLPQDVTGRHALGDFLDQRQPVVLAIVGAPGSGKTTLLRRTARQICQEHRGRRRAIPVLLFFRDHVGTVLDAPDVNLADLVRETLERGIGEPAGWFEQKLRAGDCVVMLDGLDEVARQDDRRALAAWVECQIALYPLNDYVLTSRPQGYVSARVNGAAVLQVRSLTDEQVASFVRGWYLAVERYTAGTENAEVRHKAETATGDLLERLNHAPALLDLTINPMLLTMIANIHRYRGALPGSRTRLYGEICQVILWRRQEEKGIPSQLSGDGKEILLRHLAFSMMEQRVRDLSRSAVLAAIEPILRRMSTVLTAEEFLADVGSNGLLIERESGLYSFAHHTFQEYLAASHIRDTGQPELLVAGVDDVWWRESTLLYVVGADADAIVEAGLDSGTVTALSLAFDCAEQGSHLAPELRARMDNLLGSTFGLDADRDRLRLMASVMATRQLRPTVRTEGGGRVCTRPVTQGLYWLFRQDTGALLPDGLTVSAPIRSDAELPVTGVRAPAAAAFTRWANFITGDSPSYRLPSRSEIEDPAVQRVRKFARSDTRSESLWLAPDSEPGRPQLWTPSESLHPYAMNAVDLGPPVMSDLRRAGPTVLRLLLLRALVSVRLLPWTVALASRREVGVDHVLDHIHDLAQTLRHAIALDVAGRTRYVGTLDMVDSLNAEINRERRLVRADGIDSELLRPLIEGLEDLRGGDPTEVIDLVLPTSAVMAQELAADHTFERALERAMGTALSSTVTHMLRTTAQPGSWLTDFSRKFIDRTFGEGFQSRLSPDDLADLTEETSRAFVHLFEPSREAASPFWAYRTVQEFRQAAMPMFEGRGRITSRAASELRVSALCLAAEAEAHRAPDLGSSFRRLASGVNLLEQRTVGNRVPGEGIMLATL
ncbi:NACHT domain-containing protein [Streptomyces sp. AK08-02]|uniref:NACHT domain-containing protein n=1 Tax=Streptomyces sp. AK08-02 TaxID=3028654 RepID=UPI0029B5723C|nr:NACHT domain-containing protein [Streptomyces sp. AK08-02]MDX3752180.1 NACHT domain-containing protein [Streptomyces sp. AK08-02]